MKHSFIFITAFVAKFLESCNDSCQKALCQHRMGLKFLFLTMMMVVHVPLIMYAQMRTTTYNKEIQGYENSQVDNGCYYLIASPVGEVDPENITNMLSNSYDLYYFTPGEGTPWKNYKSSTFNLMRGQGYLYANTTDFTLSFIGSPIQDDYFDVELKFDDEGEGLNNWNLVGNPFDQEAYINRNFYIMNEDGSEIIAAEGSVIHPMEGIFVLADYDEDRVTFSREAMDANGFMFALNLCSSSGVIDRAVVRFGSGRQLPKFQLRKESTKLYIPLDDVDYAVVRSQGQGEMPVHFMAENDGRYTISLSSENVDFSYLHLIDKLTGNDIDLLAHSSYTFEAKTTDDASRFRVVYSAEMSAPNNQSGESPYLSDVSSNRINRDSNVPQLPSHGEETDQPAIYYNIEVEAGAGGAVSGAGTYGKGRTCTLTAIPSEGYAFLYWTEEEEGGEVVVSNDDEYEIKVDEDKSLKAHFALMLLNGGDNSSILENTDPENVMLQGRTLYMDGSWNTLCLPFAVSDGDNTDNITFTGTPLEGFTVKELDTQSVNEGHATGFENGTLYLNFKDATSIVAGKPYIVKKLQVEGDANTIENPTFKGVELSSAAPTIVTSSDDNVSFIGSYSPVGLNKDDKTVLYLGANNTLYYPNAAMTIGSCRAYFQLNNDLTMGEASQGGGGINAFVLNFGDEETGIIQIKEERLKMRDGGDAWFMPDGRKLLGKPTVKGIYINNGNKVVIK